MESEVPKGWHTRGYLPHYDGKGVIQFVTFRLGDSLPAHVLAAWQEELQRQPVLGIERHLKLQRLVEEYLDQGAGACYLQEPRIAGLVEQSLYYFADERYQLLSWVIMPNHVHLLLKPLAQHCLTAIMRSLKSYTSHQSNKLLGRTGKFWFEDYFDRYIRDAAHYAKTVRYIENNPVKAGLCATPEEWRYGSAWWRQKNALATNAK